MVDNLDMEMDFLDFTIKVLLLSNIEFVLKSTFSDFFFISIVIFFDEFWALTVDLRFEVHGSNVS